MLGKVIIENGVKKIQALTADTGTGAPVGSIIVVCSNILPSGYLGLGVQYDITNYPALYQVLGTDTTPTASALGLPTLSSGQYAIKATSGLTENQQENVLNTINENNSYSTEEHPTGKKWIDGKPIYRKVVQKNIAITNGVDIDLSDIAIDTPISLDYVLQDGAGGSIHAYNNTDITFNFYKSGSTNNAHILINTIGGWDLRQTTQNFIIEYTKTTD